MDTETIRNLRDTTQSEIKRIKLFQDCVMNEDASDAQKKQKSKSNTQNVQRNGNDHAARSMESNKNRKKNYIHVRINGKPMKAMVDTGNTVETNVAISERLHKRLGIGFKKQQITQIGTASKTQKIKKMGISSRIFLRIDGIDKIIGINPCIIRDLSDDINLGNGFFMEVAKKMPCLGNMM